MPSRFKTRTSRVKKYAKKIVAAAASAASSKPKRRTLIRPMITNLQPANPVIVKGLGLRGLVPRRKFMKIYYTAGGELARNAGVTNYSVAFKANSLYDPDTSNGTKNTKAYGMDIIQTIYKHYRVYGCKVELTVSNKSASYPVIVVLLPHNDTTIATSEKLTNIASRDTATSMIVQQKGSTGDVQTLTKYINYKTYGYNKYQFMADGFEAATTASPSSLMVYSIIIGEPTDVDTNSLTAQYALKATFYTMLYDPVDNMDAS